MEEIDFYGEDMELIQSFQLQIDQSILLNFPTSIDGEYNGIKEEHGNVISRRLTFEEMKQRLLFTKHKLDNKISSISSKCSRNRYKSFII